MGRRTTAAAPVEDALVAGEGGGGDFVLLHSRLPLDVDPRPLPAVLPQLVALCIRAIERQRGLGQRTYVLREGHAREAVPLGVFGLAEVAVRPEAWHVVSGEERVGREHESGGEHRVPGPVFKVGEGAPREAAEEQPGDHAGGAEHEEEDPGEHLADRVVKLWRRPGDAQEVELVGAVHDAEHHHGEGVDQRHGGTVHDGQGDDGGERRVKIREARLRGREEGVHLGLGLCQARPDQAVEPTRDVEDATRLCEHLVKGNDTQRLPHGPAPREPLLQADIHEEDEHHVVDDGRHRLLGVETLLRIRDSMPSFILGQPLDDPGVHLPHHKEDNGCEL
mmetsp:Transcript_19412/g.57273  ORF Transcript_19412/g.57273 Transcript_19412/m.57273 type:complete len:335 (-) Transcript_19412:104-1108(-)